ncbi:hypothetical protein F5Y15DRAFT_114708 [Xylariaceae sp. FL0016]|nr:hypothetical protein F5Y15DRAFT_114708 [Xylariaceae sp. FL0016]
MPGRRSTGSSKTSDAGPSASIMSTVGYPEKELNPVHFDPVEYGHYKQSIDRTTIIEPPPTELVEGERPGTWGPAYRIHSAQYPEALSHREELPGDQPDQTSQAKVGEKALKQKPRRTCGMKRRWFWVTVCCIALSVIALVAGLCGGLLGREMRATTQNLAAVNWTVNNGVHHAIFTQDENDGSLIAYTGINSSWTTVNISALFDDSTLPIRNRSPLAAVAMSDPTDWQNPDVNHLRLFFTTSKNGISEIITYDPSLQDWKWGLVGPHMNHTLEIGDSSQIAATWRRCRNTTSCGLGQLFLVYESSESDLMVANSTANWEPSLAVGRVDSPPFGVTIVSAQALDYRNDSDYAWAIYKDAGVLATGWQDYAHSWNWTDASMEIKDMPPPESSKVQTLAASTFQDRTHTMLVALGSGNGTAYGNHWDPTPYAWAGARPLSLQGSSPEAQISTIAMTGDSWLYAIMDGKIQSYQMDDADPYTFHLMGEVGK